MRQGRSRLATFIMVKRKIGIRCLITCIVLCMSGAYRHAADQDHGYQLLYVDVSSGRSDAGDLECSGCKSPMPVEP